MIRAFLVRRLLISLPVLLGCCFASFMLIRIGNADPAVSIAGPMADAAEVARVRTGLGLDQPLITQFAVFMGKLAHGDLGMSWVSGQPVLKEMGDRFAASLELVFISLLLSLLIAVPVGVHVARHPGGWTDQISRLLSSLFYSVPSYWLGLMMIFVFFFHLNWAPAPMGRLPVDMLSPPTITGSNLIDGALAGQWDVVAAQLRQIALPVITLVVTSFAPLLKQTRAICLDVLGSEYIRLSRAYGYRTSTVIRIVLRNSLVPLVTFTGTELTALLASVTLIEYVFSWGGLGQWGLNSILSGDYAAVQGYILVLSLFSIVVFAVVDLLVLVAEPRAGRR